MQVVMDCHRNYHGIRNLVQLLLCVVTAFFFDNSGIEYLKIFNILVTRKQVQLASRIVFISISTIKINRLKTRLYCLI